MDRKVVEQCKTPPCQSYPDSVEGAKSRIRERPVFSVAGTGGKSAVLWYKQVLQACSSAADLGSIPLDPLPDYFSDLNVCYDMEEEIKGTPYWLKSCPVTTACSTSPHPNAPKLSA
jgi:hypothetical protein